MREIHYTLDMVCPYCGNPEFYIKQRYRGYCEYNMRFDLEETENGEMFEGAKFTATSKYAYCNNCGKRLFELSELPYQHN